MYFLRVAIIFSVIFVVVAVILDYFDFKLIQTATIFSAIATMIIAYFTSIGLPAWKEKMKYDTTTQLLASIYEYRNAISEFANPFMSLIIDSDEEEPQITEEQKIFEAHKNLKSERFDKMVSARQKIYADISIINVSWSEKLRSIIDEMYKIEIIIRRRTECRLIIANPDIDAGHPTRHDAEKELKAMREDPTNDYEKLQERLDKLVKEAEDFLKPHLVL